MIQEKEESRKRSLPPMNEKENKLPRLSGLFVCLFFCLFLPLVLKNMILVFCTVLPGIWNEEPT